jgi:hypothetical protein
MAHLRVLVAVQDCKSVFLRSKLVCLLVVWEATCFAFVYITIRAWACPHGSFSLDGYRYCLEYYCVCPADGLEIVHYLVCSLDSHKRAKVRVM